MARMRETRKPLYKKRYVDLDTVEERILNLTSPDTLEDMRDDLVAAQALATLVCACPSSLKPEQVQQVAGAIEGYVSSVLSWALWNVDREAEESALQRNRKKAAA